MKKHILSTILIIVVSFTSFSQSLGYKDLGVLFSQNNKQGTARFNAMSGAFGALGGDLSVTSINPAGLAIFSSSHFSMTADVRSNDIATNFYGKNVANQNVFFGIPQAGGVFIIEPSYNDNWTKVALGFNYQKVADFRNNFIAKGNSGFATFTYFPPAQTGSKIIYKNAISQTFDTSYSGDISEFSVALSGAYQNKLYIGLAINLASLDFDQQSYFSEKNQDNNGNTLNGRLFQRNYTQGSGFSLTAGALYKINKMFRVGAAYKTPTWYTELIKETNYTDEKEIEGDEIITVSNLNDQQYSTKTNLETLNYQLRTPSELTLSGAIVIGKQGLLSADYTYKNFTSIKLSNADFSDINPFFSNGLRNTHSLRVGGEYRLDDLSLRAGYSYEKNPNLILGGNTNKDNLRGFSIGAGYNFKGFKIDLAYSDKEQLSFYDLYHQKRYRNQNLEPINLDINNRVFSATLSFNL